MTLCDAGPLFALVDPRQGDLHERCKKVLPSLPSPLVTTWPSFTEAMYLAHRRGRWSMPKLLWKYVSGSTLGLFDLGPEDIKRMQELMEMYRDTPMDLADASLVTLAERLDQRRIFTLALHFLVYRLRGRTALEVVPKG